jgi:hypothetical protein
MSYAYASLCLLSSSGDVAVDEAFCLGLSVEVGEKMETTSSAPEVNVVLRFCLVFALLGLDLRVRVTHNTHLHLNGYGVGLDGILRGGKVRVFDELLAKLVIAELEGHFPVGIVYYRRYLVGLQILVKGAEDRVRVNDRIEGAEGLRGELLGVELDAGELLPLAGLFVGRHRAEVFVFSYRSFAEVAVRALGPTRLVLG